MIIARRTMSRSGYVLPLVLVALALAGAATAAICRMNLRRITEANLAAEELQRRWGVLSCQSTLLPRANHLIQSSTASDNQPARWRRVELVLGGQHFTAVVFDEQAKANVKVLRHRKDLSQVATSMRALLDASGNSLPVADDVLIGDSAALVTPEALVGGVAPGLMFNADDPDASPLAYLTCWGDGRTNAKRASAAVLREVCDPYLDPGALVRLRTLRQRPDLSLDDILSRLKLSPQKEDRLIPLVTDRSTCFSLWIVVQNGRRSWYHLAITDSGTSEDESPLLFSW